MKRTILARFALLYTLLMTQAAVAEVLTFEQAQEKCSEIGVPGGMADSYLDTDEALGADLQAAAIVCGGLCPASSTHRETAIGGITASLARRMLVALRSSHVRPFNKNDKKVGILEFGLGAQMLTPSSYCAVVNPTLPLVLMTIPPLQD